MIRNIVDLQILLASMFPQFFVARTTDGGVAGLQHLTILAGGVFKVFYVGSREHLFSCDSTGARFVDFDDEGAWATLEDFADHKEHMKEIRKFKSSFDVVLDCENSKRMQYVASAMLVYPDTSRPHKNSDIDARPAGIKTVSELVKILRERYEILSGKNLKSYSEQTSLYSQSSYENDQFYRHYMHLTTRYSKHYTESVALDLRHRTSKIFDSLPPSIARSYALLDAIYASEFGEGLEFFSEISMAAAQAMLPKLRKLAFGEDF